MRSLPSKVPVIVIGAGPTGLAAANLLGSMGVEVLVLEKYPTPLIIPRAIVLDDEGARTFQAVGLTDELLNNVLEGDGPTFVGDNGEVLVQVGIGTREFGFCKRYFIHQPDIEAILRRGLDRFDSVRLLCDAEVISLQNEPDQVTLEVRYAGAIHTIRTDVLLACDGANSTARRLMGIAMEGSTYADDWLIIDMVRDPDTERRTKYHCSLRRPVVSIPAPRGGRRYEFKLLGNEARENPTAFPFVQRLLKPFRTVTPEDIQRVAVYTFQARVAEHLVAGRTLLLGDAAHLTPPFAGQGMNAGLRDAMNLAWKVALVIRGEADVALLRSYGIERRKPIAAMIQLAVSMGDIIMPRDEADRQLLAELLRRLNDHPGAREFFFGMKFKPRPRYAEGVFVGINSPNVPASLVGSLIPQPLVARAGSVCRLDDVIGQRFTILVQNETTEKWAVEHLATLWPELNPLLISFAECGTVSNARTPVLRLKSNDAEVFFPFLAHRDQLLLIRPDRYVAAAFWTEQAGEAVPEFRNALQLRVGSGAAAAYSQQT